MNGAAAEAVEHVASKHPGLSRRALWQAAILALLIGFLYHEILWRLVQNWWIDPNFSHGFFVPAFSAYVIWQRRAKLAALPVQPAWSGLLLIAGSLGVLIVGVMGAELFLSRSSLLFLLAGLVIHLLGWRHFRAMFFPWACFFLMIPIPVIVFNHVAFPLQLLASRLASSLLVLFDVPVLREGNVLHLPAMTLEVVQACSGIRSLVSLGTLAIIYGYFLEPSARRRAILAVAAIPIAIAANGSRVVGTGLLVNYWEPGKAEGFFHAFEGWVIFVLSLGMLFAVHGFMGLSDRWRVWRQR